MIIRSFVLFVALTSFSFGQVALAEHSGFRGAGRPVAASRVSSGVFGGRYGSLGAGASRSIDITYNRTVINNYGGHSRWWGNGWGGGWGGWGGGWGGLGYGGWGYPSLFGGYGYPYGYGGYGGYGYGYGGYGYGGYGYGGYGGYGYGYGGYGGYGYGYGGYGGYGYGYPYYGTSSSFGFSLGIL